MTIRAVCIAETWVVQSTLFVCVFVCLCFRDLIRQQIKPGQLWLCFGGEGQRSRWHIESAGVVLHRALGWL